MLVDFLVRRRGFRCGTHFVSNDNRGGLHASDNSCLPPESVAGVRLSPRSGAVPCMPDFGDHHCIVHIQVRLWERYVVTARSKEMHKPVDVATYTLFSMAPVMRNFRC